MNPISLFSKNAKIASLAVALSVAGASAAHASSIQVSYLAPGVQSQTGAAYHTETFNNGFNGTTTYGNSGINGTYTGAYVVDPANQYGGANGGGLYIWPPFSSSQSESYTISLSTGVNYFGLWWSAQDPGDQIQIYNGSTLLLTFNAVDLSAGIGTCPSASAYCGNPNAPYTGQVDISDYAFVNFYLPSGTFDKIVVTQLLPNNGFETDNHTVANLNAPPPGTVLGATPEPSSLVLLGTGVLGIAGGLRRRIKR